MYIKMNDDKSLTVTVPTTIYRGEHNAGLITFLLPSKYEDIDIASCSVLLRYLLPDGTDRSEELALAPELYKTYCQFQTRVNTRLTAVEGRLKAWLTCVSYQDDIVFKTGEVTIPVLPSKNISEYLPAEELDQLDRLDLQVKRLDQSKADNIVYRPDDRVIQLTACGEPIGEAIDMTPMVPDDDVIHFDTESPSPSGGADDVIHF